MENKTTYCVYIHAKQNGLPFYVGKASDLNRPYRVDCKYRNKAHQAIVLKHGAKNILVRVLPCVSEADAFKREIAIITALRAIGFSLTNIASGGQGCAGFKQSPEQKAKTSATHKGKVLSEQTKKRISDSKKGSKLSAERIEQMRVSSTGRKLSAAAKEKISRFHKTYRHSAETLEKMAAARIGRTLSDEHKRKIGAAHRGRHLTEDHKAKIGLGNKGKKRLKDKGDLQGVLLDMIKESQ